MTDDELMDGIVQEVRDFVARAAEPIERRLAAIEAREPLRGEKGDSGERGIEGPAGRDGAEGAKGMDGARGADGAVGQKGEPGEKGEPGVDGRSFTADEVQALVDAAVARAVAALPPTKDGINGKDGANGVDGKDGRDGIDGKDGAAGINGKDGAQGVEGKSGAPGIDGKDGRDGIDGKDGAAGIQGEIGPIGQKGADGVAGRDGRDGMQGLPGIQGEKGIDGRNGVDGFSLNDLEFEAKDDGRVLALRFISGERREELEAKTANLIYRGVFETGKGYERGDSVSYGGSMWVAKRDTSQAPPGDEWQLAVKRGKDAA